MKMSSHEMKGGRWKIYEKPIPEYRYVIGCDTASGKQGANETVATALCVNTGVQVAVYGGLIPPEEFSVEVEKAGYYFNEACIVVEREFHGITVINYLISKQYPNVYLHPNKLISTTGGAATEWGWDALHYRQIAIDWLSTDVGYTISSIPSERGKALWVKDPETLTQMGYFMRNQKTGKYEALYGKYDDRVSALYIANYVRREKFSEVFAPPEPKEPELTFLEKIQMKDRRSERDPGRRFGED